MIRWWRRLRGRKRPDQGCRACGICCELYGHTLSVSPYDRARWQREGRGDLLNRIGPEGALWFDPAAGERLPHCPFLDRRGLCGIHDTKPEICRAYPTSVHGYRCVRGFRIEASAR